MAIWTMASLTLKEAVRRKTLWGALFMGLLVLGLSLLLIPIHARLENRLMVHRIDAATYAFNTSLARSSVLSLCLSAIKALGALFAALLAGGAISGEIERGLLAVILPRPYPRWHILLGKWIGLNIILVVSTLAWTAIVWASFRVQTTLPLGALLPIGLYLCVFPLMLCTLTLTISAIAPRLFGTTLALTLAALAWFDGILNQLGSVYDVDILHQIAAGVGLIVPQGYVGWWIERASDDNIVSPLARRSLGDSPELITELGRRWLHFGHLDAVYIAVYIVVVLASGMVLFERRDVS